MEKRRVDCLSSGDVTSRGEEVVSIVRRGLSIPTGKCEVVLRHVTRRTTRKVQWNNSTEIALNA